MKKEFFKKYDGMPDGFTTNAGFMKNRKNIFTAFHKDL